MITWLLTQEPTPHWALLVLIVECTTVGFAVGQHVYHGRYKAR